MGDAMPFVAIDAEAPVLGGRGHERFLFVGKAQAL